MEACIKRLPDNYTPEARQYLCESLAAANIKVSDGVWLAKQLEKFGAWPTHDEWITIGRVLAAGYSVKQIYKYLEARLKAGVPLRQAVAELPEAAEQGLKMLLKVRAEQDAREVAETPKSAFEAISEKLKSIFKR